MRYMKAIKRRWVFFLVNYIYCGTDRFERKRKLLNSIGFCIGEGSKVVGPIFCSGTLTVGKDCWIGKNFTVNGNGKVTIGDRCDIAPEVSFNTGGHKIGDADRRAGEGVIFCQSVGSGTWMGARSTVINETKIGESCVVAACACVCKDVPDHMLVGGVPAKIIRSLQNDSTTVEK